MRLHYCLPTAFTVSSTGRTNASMNAVCELVRQLCRWCCDGSVVAFLQWLTAAAELWLRERKPVSAALTHTLAAVSVTLHRIVRKSYVTIITLLMFQLKAHRQTGFTSLLMILRFLTVDSFRRFPFRNVTSRSLAHVCRLKKVELLEES